MVGAAALVLQRELRGLAAAAADRAPDQRLGLGRRRACAYEASVPHDCPLSGQYGDASFDHLERADSKTSVWTSD